MERVQKEMSKQYPEIRTFFSSGSMVDAILNSGMPAPIDVQVSGRSLKQNRTASPRIWRVAFGNCREWVRSTFHRT